MTNLRTSFHSDTLLRLTGDQSDQLTTTGETTINYSPSKDLPVSEDAFWLSISSDTSAGPYFFEFEPKQDIDRFINNSYLTHFFPKTGKIKLIPGLEEPLVLLLPKHLNNTADIPLIEKLHFSAQQDIFDDELLEASVNSLISTGNLQGQISCCECGVGGCSSDYLWAVNNVGLASFHILAAGLQCVSLYPFRLE